MASNYAGNSVTCLCITYNIKIVKNRPTLVCLGFVYAVVIPQSD